MSKFGGKGYFYIQSLQMCETFLDSSERPKMLLKKNDKNSNDYMVAELINIYELIVSLIDRLIHMESESLSNRMSEKRTVRKYRQRERN